MTNDNHTTAMHILESTLEMLNDDDQEAALTQMMPLYRAAPDLLKLVQQYLNAETTRDLLYCQKKTMDLIKALEKK